MEPIIYIGGGVVAIAACSYIGTRVMLAYPGTRTWLQSKAIEAYNYLDAHKDEIPEECKPLWLKAYKLADDAVDAFNDDELTWAETKRLGFGLIGAVNEVRRLCAI